MPEITRSAVARVGVDLSKRAFQLHAVNRAGRVVLAKAFAPDWFFAWCADTSPPVDVQSVLRWEHRRRARTTAGSTLRAPSGPISHWPLWGSPCTTS